MTRAIRCNVMVVATLALMFGPGCGGDGSEADKTPVTLPAQVYVDDIVNTANPARRAAAAQALAKLPAEQLREHLPALKKALETERDARMRKAIQAVVDKAR